MNEHLCCLNRYKKCCCNCDHRITIYAHPENPVGKGYGRITDVFGYGCANPEIARKSAFYSSSGHGLCELWSEIVETV